MKRGLLVSPKMSNPRIKALYSEGIGWLKNTAFVSLLKKCSKAQYLYSRAKKLRPQSHNETRGEATARRHVVAQDRLQLVISRFCILGVHFSIVVNVENFIGLLFQLFVVDLHVAIEAERLNDDEESAHSKGD